MAEPSELTTLEAFLDEEPLAGLLETAVAIVVVGLTEEVTVLGALERDEESDPLLVT